MVSGASPVLALSASGLVLVSEACFFGLSRVLVRFMAALTPREAMSITDRVAVFKMIDSFSRCSSRKFDST